MKRYYMLALSMVLVAIAAAGGVKWALADVSGAPVTAASAIAADQRAVFKVEALSCGSCEYRIKESLKVDPGVSSVTANLEDRTVTVDYAKTKTDERKIAEVITKAGYPAQFLSFATPGVQTKTKSAARNGCGGNCCGSQPG